MDSLAGSNIENIDYLPVRFREQSEARTVNVWRVLAVGCFAAMVLAGAWMQQRTLKDLETQLVQVTSNHAVAVARTERLSAAKGELALAKGHAELATYLRHPWPRSQVLAAIVASLPETVQLDEIRFVRQLSTQQRDRASAASKSSDRSAGTDVAVQDPAIIDLKLLRDTVGEVELVQLAGSTSDVVALYDYLAEIGNHPLIESAKVDSTELEERGPVVPNRGPSDKRTAGKRQIAKPIPAAAEPTGRTSFRASIVLRGGYGQPNGPTAPVGPIPAGKLPTATDDKVASDDTETPAV